MFRKLTKYLIIGALTMQMSAFADYVFPNYVGTEVTEVIGIPAVNKISIDPLMGKSQIKQGTVKQDGWLYGLRVSFDIVNPNNIYLGGEIGCKFGDLKGNLKAENPLFLAIDPINDEIIVKDKTKSKYSDLWAELRAGFTFGGVGMSGGYLSPFLLVGYEKEKNDYVSPTPIELKYKLTYGYFGCGIVSDFYLSNMMSIGMNAKFKWMFKAKNKTSGDSYLEDKGISNANHFHWSIEIPVKYFINANTIVAIVPFYESKQYDLHKIIWMGKEKANFNMWGAFLSLGLVY